MMSLLPGYLLVATVGTRRGTYYYMYVHDVHTCIRNTYYVLQYMYYECVRVVRTCIRTPGMSVDNW